MAPGLEILGFLIFVDERVNLMAKWQIDNATNWQSMERTTCHLKTASWWNANKWNCKFAKKANLWNYKLIKLKVEKKQIDQMNRWK